MSEINYEISASMQNRFAVHRENRLKSNDVVSETSSREQLDSVEISDEAVRQQNENASLDKKLEALMHHFMEQFSSSKSLDMYRVDDPFKMELCASSCFGDENLFQNYSECQYKVFDEWLKENASELSEETCAKIQEAVKNATTVMDQFNAMSGYCGTSFESVALLEASRFALENVKNTIVPESQRSDFGKLIDEYVRFNEESRNNIMERMTPNYMYEDIGKSTQFLRNKDELISSQRSFYKREKEDIRDLLREYYSETANKGRAKTKLQQYTERYHKKNNPMYSDSSLFDNGFVNLMVQ